ncbi:MAG: polysaccharide deacetylase family protein [Streptosporangiales bacterium]
MPYDVPYDLERASRRILDVLANYEARAVFFVVGRIAEDYPQIVRALAEAGHEVGLHGYEHEDLGAYDQAQLAKFDRDLCRVEGLVEKLTGKRPKCFRAPYLLGPRFYRREVYALLRRHGYAWVSNREIRYPIELFRPDRISIPIAWSRHLADSRLGLTALNAGLLAKESFGGSARGRLRWLLTSREPFDRDGLIEVPLYAPLDCDLVLLPAPEEDTPPKLLAYARNVARAAAVGQGPLSMVTFHDWIVAGGNRLVLLDEALAAARAQGRKVRPFNPVSGVAAHGSTNNDNAPAGHS